MIVFRFNFPQLPVFLFSFAADDGMRSLLTSEQGDKDGINDVNAKIKLPLGDNALLPCNDICANTFSWSSEGRHLPQVDENWGVLLLLNISRSIEYTCTAGITQSTKTFAITAVGKFACLVNYFWCLLKE